MLERFTSGKNTARVLGNSLQVVAGEFRDYLNDQKLETVCYRDDDLFNPTNNTLKRKEL